eukprot:TRINITY_DN24538_c0_g1_i1.p1 TRINITY_DN24538_c0_g1~~TRINITY_DN24538_c0_g1_i1.p1  ORF type:complete len:969 (+),score=214.42 TRINITY_DN24538_c0_g1_i1:89-2908(+)
MSLEEQLTELREMLGDGTITQDEFEEFRSAMVRRASGGALGKGAARGQALCPAPGEAGAGRGISKGWSEPTAAAKGKGRGKGRGKSTPMTDEGEWGGKGNGWNAVHGGKGKRGKEEEEYATGRGKGVPRESDSKGKKGKGGVYEYYDSGGGKGRGAKGRADEDWGAGWESYKGKRAKESKAAAAWESLGAEGGAGKGAKAKASKGAKGKKGPREAVPSSSGAEETDGEVAPDAAQGAEGVVAAPLFDAVPLDAPDAAGEAQHAWIEEQDIEDYGAAQAAEAATTAAGAQSAASAPAPAAAAATFRRPRPCNPPATNLVLNCVEPLPVLPGAEWTRWPLMSTLQLNDFWQEGRQFQATVVGSLSLFVDQEWDVRAQSECIDFSTMRPLYDEGDAQQQLADEMLYAVIFDETGKSIIRIPPQTQPNQNVVLPPPRAQVAMKVVHKGHEPGVLTKPLYCAGFIDFASTMLIFPESRLLPMFERVTLGLEPGPMLSDQSMRGAPEVGWPFIGKDMNHKSVFHRERSFLLLVSEADIRFQWPQTMCIDGISPGVVIGPGHVVTLKASYKGYPAGTTGVVRAVLSDAKKQPFYSMWLFSGAEKQSVPNVPHCKVNNLKLRPPGPCPQGLRFLYPYEGGFDIRPMALMGDQPPLVAKDRTPTVICDMLRIEADNSTTPLTVVVDPEARCLRFLKLIHGQGTMHEDVWQLEPRLVRTITVMMAVNDEDEANLEIPDYIRNHVLFGIRYYRLKGPTAREDVRHGKNWESRREVLVTNMARIRRFIQVLEGLALDAATMPPVHAIESNPPFAEPWAPRPLPSTDLLEECAPVDRAHGIPFSPPLLWNRSLHAPVVRPVHPAAIAAKAAKLPPLFTTPPLPEGLQPQKPQLPVAPSSALPFAPIRKLDAGQQALGGGEAEAASPAAKRPRTLAVKIPVARMPLPVHADEG